MRRAVAPCSERVVPSRSESHPSIKSEADHPPIGDAKVRKAELACDGVLEGVPTTFAKLVTLAGMRTPGSGDYGHRQLDGMYPPALVTLVLQKRHERVFADWINLGLEEQHKQLAEFFASMWTQGAPRLPLEVRRALVPATAREPERVLFLADIECMLSVMDVGER